MKLLDTRVDGWKKLAEGSSETERALVEKLIEGKGGEGYERFGEKLADVLHKWLLERAKLLLDDLPPVRRDPDISEMTISEMTISEISPRSLSPRSLSPRSRLPRRISARLADGGAAISGLSFGRRSARRRRSSTR